MKLSYCPYSLEFKHPFGLSYGSRLTTEIVFVRLECEGVFGFGEASLPPYLGETQQTVVSFFRKVKLLLEKIQADFSIETLHPEIDALFPGNTAAKAAIDIALHDLKGKLESKPVHQLLGFDKPEPKPTSYTISIGSPDLIHQKIEEANDFEILKIKLGTTDDQAIIEKVRQNTSKTLVLDVNQGWKSKEYALEMTKWLSDKNILYIEQPLPKENYENIAWLSAESTIPIIADEGFGRLKDFERTAECYNGINIKLMKCTGLYEAAQIIHKAKEKNMLINLGCMSESSCGISAATQLMSGVNWIDLDAPLLIKNDPFNGVNYSHGKIEPTSGDGIGAKENTGSKIVWI